MSFVVGSTSHALAAEEGGWSVSKSSGDVWMTTTGAQPVSLGKAEVLKPGDSIRTGRNGRVLLVRGEETIMVSPNSVIDEVVVTNTIPLSDEAKACAKVRQLSVAFLFAETMRRISDGESVTSLFAEQNSNF